jgi:hypothetical protein
MGLNRLRNTQFLVNDEVSPVNAAFDRAYQDEICTFKLLNHQLAYGSFCVQFYADCINT